jgi:hypothetical protein
MGDYLTLSEVKAQLVDMDTGSDAFLTSLITRASRDVDRLTGQFFDLSTSVTRTFDGDGSRILFLPWAWPLNAVTTLTVKAGTNGSPQTVASTDYFLEPGGRPNGWPARWIELSDQSTSGYGYFGAGKRTISITGDFGWAATPDEIKEVCLELVVRGWRMRGSGDSEAIGLQGAIGTFSEDNIPRSLSPRSIAVLRKHGMDRPEVF